MPVDFLQVKEVTETISEEVANRYLKSSKWVLIEVKIVEDNCVLKRGERDDRTYIHKGNYIIYILGRIK